MENQEMFGVAQEEPGAETGGESMESMLGQYAAQEIQRGKLVEGTVVSAVEDGWLLDVGYKCEAHLPRKEWSHRALVQDTPEPAVGEKVRVQVVNIVQNEESQLIVSRWRSEFDERWVAVEEALNKSDIVSVRGIRKVKGGLIVDCCGIEGFIPISHLAEEGRGINPGRFVDEDFDVKLLEKDRKKRRLVFSRRMILEEEMTSKRGSFYEDTVPGDVREGTVSSITSFGVFVNLGPVEGLVHNTELSWQRNAKPKDLVKKGDVVKVRVIDINKETNRVSLSMKQLQSDPWDTVTERWQKDSRTTGTVTNLTDFGAFVEIEPGIEGLIHIGDLSWSRIKSPKEVLHKGDSVEVQILEVDPSRRRISLGYKQLHDPWESVPEQFNPGTDVTVKVVRLAEFGAFVELQKGVEGLIHISQLSRQRVEKPEDVLQEKQEVLARILEVDAANRRIRLSLSALQPEEPGTERASDRGSERPVDRGSERGSDRPDRGGDRGDRGGDRGDRGGDRGDRGGDRGDRGGDRGDRGGDRGDRRRRTNEARVQKTAPYPQEDASVTLGDLFGDVLKQ